MQRQIVAAIAAGVMTLLGAPTARAASRPELVLTGDHTAWVEVTLHSRTTFDLLHASISGSGSYAGVYAEDISKPAAGRWQAGESIGLVQIRDYHGPGESSYSVEFDQGFNTPYLAPGRYRFYLATDGPAVVKVPMSNGPSLTLHPALKTYSAVAVKQNALVNPLQASNRQPLLLRGQGQRILAFSTITLGNFRAYAGEIEACLAFAAKACGTATNTGVDGAWTGEFVSPVRPTEFSWMVGYEPGTLKPGRYDAIQSALNAATIQFATAAAFTLTLV